MLCCDVSWCLVLRVCCVVLCRVELNRCIELRWCGRWCRCFVVSVGVCVTCYKLCHVFDWFYGVLCFVVLLCSVALCCILVYCVVVVVVLCCIVARFVVVVIVLLLRCGVSF